MKGKYSNWNALVTDDDSPFQNPLFVKRLFSGRHERNHTMNDAVTFTPLDQRSYGRKHFGVKLGRKRVGTIKPIKEGGWQYFPTGQKEGGPIFATLSAVQRDVAGK